MCQGGRRCLLLTNLLTCRQRSSGKLCWCRHETHRLIHLTGVVHWTGVKWDCVIMIRERCVCRVRIIIIFLKLITSQLVCFLMPTIAVSFPYYYPIPIPTLNTSFKTNEVNNLKKVNSLQSSSEVLSVLFQFRLCNQTYTHFTWLCGFSP